MSQASDYPITFGYKATDGVYYGPNGSVGPYHRGEDRAMPNNTPVIVNGVTIGLSNNTGASSGSHLHIGRYVDGSDTAPNGGGFSFNSAVVYDTGYDTTNGNYVRITGDGALWNYLHLESTLVTKGQVLKENNMPSVIDLNTAKQGFIAYWTPEQVAAAGGDAFVAGFVGTESNAFINALATSPQFTNKRLDQEQTEAELAILKAQGGKGYTPYTGAELFLKET